MVTPPPRKWRGPVGIKRTMLPQRNYNSLLYMGRLPPRIDLKDRFAGRNVVSKHSYRLGASVDALNKIHNDRFMTVIASVKNVNKTIASYDSANYKIGYGPEDTSRDQFYHYGIEFFSKYYGHIFYDSISTDEEMTTMIDWTKSAGYTASFYGIRTKQELIQDSGFLESDHCLYPTKTVPITSVANKVEPKELVDIEDDKIRHFFISEYHLFREQIRFGKKSSLRLKNLNWSAYGFSPFMGGAHRLATDILSKKVRFFYDVSGWDKFLPVMRDIYSLIYTHSNIPAAYKDQFIWMTKWSVSFMCCMYDGDVVLKKYGNASGSGTTTRDNIIAHIIFVAAYLSEAYFIRFGELPPHFVLNQQVVKVFGDDSIISVDEDFSHVLHDGFLAGFFARYGMKLKFLHGGFDYDITKMQFLGFTFRFYNGFYIPLYDEQRLALSMIHVNEKSDTLEAYVSKVFVLTMMSFACESYPVFKLAYDRLISSLIDNNSPVILSFREIKLSTAVLEGFYIGRESSFQSELSFFSSVWEGRKQDCYYDSRSYTS